MRHLVSDDMQARYARNFQIRMFFWVLIVIRKISYEQKNILIISIHLFQNIVSMRVSRISFQWLQDIHFRKRTLFSMISEWVVFIMMKEIADFLPGSMDHSIWDSIVRKERQQKILSWILKWMILCEFLLSMAKRKNHGLLQMLLSKPGKNIESTRQENFSLS